MTTTTTSRNGNVFADLGFEPEEAANLKIRSGLMIAIQKHIKANKLTQVQAAKRFGVSQPRVSNLVGGKIELFSIDMLVNMLSLAGVPVTLEVGEAPHYSPREHAMS